MREVFRTWQWKAALEFWLHVKAEAMRLQSELLNAEQPVSGRCGHSEQLRNFRWVRRTVQHRVVTPEAEAAAMEAEHRLDLELRVLRQVSAALLRESLAAQVGLGHALEESNECAQAAFMSSLLDEQEVRVVEAADRFWQCPVCLGDKRSTLYNCGHGTCAQCDARLDRCPECRQPIVDRYSVEMLTLSLPELRDEPESDTLTSRTEL